MFAFVFMLPEEKRRVKGGARQNRKNKIRYLFLLYAKKEALSSQSRKKTSHLVKSFASGFATLDCLLPICCTAAKASMDSPRLPAIRFLLLL